MTRRDDFFDFFGFSSADVPRLCLLVPFLTGEMKEAFGIKNFTNGSLFSSGSNGCYRVIRTGIGAPFAGDCVLRLSQTSCQELFFFGSCGSVRSDLMEDTSLLTVEKAFSSESFTSMLRGDAPLGPFYPDDGLMQDIACCKGDIPLRRTTVLSCGSIALEKEYLSSLNGKIDVVDMETSAFLAASSACSKKAASFLFATDSLDGAPVSFAYARPARKALRDKTAFFAGLADKILRNLSSL